MSTNVKASTFLPGGIASGNQLALAPPYIFVITISGLILVLIIVIIIREILKSRGMLRDCCNCNISGIRCLGCQECCIGCAQACDCCSTTSIESCLDACCPKRGSIEFADIITCEACCSGQCCSCGNTVCVCAPTDVSNVNCLCCACEQRYPQRDDDDDR
ncbi:unnamed protein product [Rotaria sordida]|uniref:Uncharacterized protein n=1 Tax=Rotaria sordida TaxID=392033 RepID=A0A815SSW4_9BILA|nr:unnamed protein product [Rotaria sordida]CAF1194228.1 unnamed protein product [Rotaria sordida]CAF1217509.1 unnamed protein product [Rotaria sordida]CAF1220028.1 unnamed protein product [Rotaria sordida]CAF1261162.1 unnamed protein product [Rotaria sordida]